MKLQKAACERLSLVLIHTYDFLRRVKNIGQTWSQICVRRELNVTGGEIKKKQKRVKLKKWRGVKAAVKSIGQNKHADLVF